MPQVRHKINNKTITINANSIDSFLCPITKNTNNNVIPIPSENNIDNIINNTITRQEILDKLSNHTIKFSLIEIKNKIVDLSDNELKEIFKIIKNNNEKYSTNKNGIFINLNILKNITIQELSECIYFADNNKILDNLDEIERAKYKNIIHIN